LKNSIVQLINFYFGIITKMVEKSLAFNAIISRPSLILGEKMKADDFLSLLKKNRVAREVQIDITGSGNFTGRGGGL
jgi:hypothetical protein